MPAGSALALKRRIEPEVYIRIVHVALHGQSGPDTYREQTVDIALGPKGAFEKGNTGTLTRRLPAYQAGSAVPGAWECLETVKIIPRFADRFTGRQGI
jgi:hypothetical protein